MGRRSLREMVRSKAWLSADLSIVEALERLKSEDLDFAPVVSGSKVTGLVDRSKLQSSLSSQYGWSLMSKKTLGSMDWSLPVVFDADGDWVDLMSIVVSRPRESVFDDVLLLSQGKYCGMICVRDLMVVQMQSYAKQLRKMEQQASLLKKTLSSYMIDHGSDEGRFEEKMQVVLRTAQKLESLEFRHRESPVDEVQLSGDLEHFSSTDLIQLVVQGRKTGTLLISDQSVGEFHLHFDQGHIIHAESTEHIGKYAVWAALFCKRGLFRFTYDEAYPVRTVEEDAMMLLVEGARRMDEAMANQQSSTQSQEAISLVI